MYLLLLLFSSPFRFSESTQSMLPPLRLPEVSSSPSNPMSRTRIMIIEREYHGCTCRPPARGQSSLNLRLYAPKIYQHLNIASCTRIGINWKYIKDLPLLSVQRAYPRVIPLNLSVIPCSDAQYSISNRIFRLPPTRQNLHPPCQTFPPSPVHTTILINPHSNCAHTTTRQDAQLTQLRMASASPGCRITT